MLNPNKANFLVQKHARKISYSAGYKKVAYESPVSNSSRDHTLRLLLCQACDTKLVRDYPLKPRRSCPDMWDRHCRSRYLVSVRLCQEPRTNTNVFARLSIIATRLTNPAET